MARPQQFNIKGMRSVFRDGPVPKGAPENANECFQTLSLKFTDAADDSDTAELLIMDVIGEDWWTGGGITGKMVIDFLDRNADKKIHVKMDSGGGDVYDGITIFNALVNHPKDVTVTVEALAFSAASYIAMAGDTLRMQATANFGIHASSSMCYGNQKNMLAMAEWLERIDNTILDIYQARGTMEREQLEEWFQGTDNDGTLFSATEALEAGFIDEVIPIPSKETKSTEPKEDAATTGKKSKPVAKAEPKVSAKEEESQEESTEEAQKRIAAAAERRARRLNQQAAAFRDERLARIGEPVG